MGDPRSKKFDDTLWHNFDAVFLRVTRGRHDLKAFAGYLVERAAIEDEYSKKLAKLAAKPEFEAGGTLNKCWTDVREATKNLGHQHAQLATVCVKEICKELDGSMREIKKNKTDMQKTHQKLVAEREKRQHNHDRARQRFEEAVKAAETAVLNRDAGQKDQFAEKKMQALEKKVEASTKDVDKSQQAYEESVRALKQIQEEFDKQLREHLAAFEVMERQREAVLLEQLKRFEQNHDFLKSSLDQICLLLNKGIGEVNIEKDIQDYIQENEAKDNPPAHVVYVPIQSPILDHARNGQGIPAPKGDVPMGNGAPSSFGGGGGHNERKQSDAAPLGAAPPVQHRQSQKMDRMVVALYDFESPEEDELSFKAGDKIKVLEGVDGEDWWKGELNGKVGSFPANYVQEQALAPQADAPRLMDAKCQALYEFVAQGADELSFKPGTILHVTGELNGWYLGKTTDGSAVGIFPANYVKML